LFVRAAELAVTHSGRALRPRDDKSRDLLAGEQACGMRGVTEGKRKGEAENRPRDGMAQE